MERLVAVMACLVLSAAAAGADRGACDDRKYLKLKKKDLTKMSDEDYEYLDWKDKECKAWLGSMMTPADGAGDAASAAPLPPREEPESPPALQEDPESPPPPLREASEPPPTRWQAPESRPPL